MIGEFAQRFGQHPDDVYARTSFNTIAGYKEAAIRKGEFNDRYSEQEKAINGTDAPK